MSVGGPTRVTSAPRADRAFTLERATRECLTSPTMATFIPANESPRWRRSVKASRSAWVGCSCQPSPALTIEASIHPEMRCGTPDDRWRTTMASMPMASTVRTVSRSDSPLRSEDDPAGGAGGVDGTTHRRAAAVVGARDGGGRGHPQEGGQRTQPRRVAPGGECVGAGDGRGVPGPAPAWGAPAGGTTLGLDGTE